MLSAETFIRFIKYYGDGIMHGDEKCPFSQHSCEKNECELWTHDQNCAINLLVRLLMKIEGTSRT